MAEPPPPAPEPAEAPPEAPVEVATTRTDTVPEVLAVGGRPKLGPAAEPRRAEEARGGDWAPKTRLGQLVRSGQITSMRDALRSGLPLREPQIVDILLPELADDVTSVNMVQRMTDSGRRVRFSIQCVVGNRDGFVGIGMAKGKEVGPSIRKAIDNAKLNLIEIYRGCGSWECGCGTPHTVPFQVRGVCGSAEILVKPAPRGVGLAVGEIAKKVLALGGIKDAWGFARGQTRTAINAAQATFDALEATTQMRLSEAQLKRTKILKGSAGGPVTREAPPAATPPGGGP